MGYYPEFDSILDGVDYSFAKSSEAIYALSNLLSTISSSGIFQVGSIASGDPGSLDDLGDLPSGEVNPQMGLTALEISDITNSVVEPSFPQLPYLLPGSAHYKELPEVLIDPNSIVSYTSSLLTLVGIKLADRIANGNTIWPAETEEEAFILVDEEVQQALEDKKDLAADEWARKGFIVPDGQLMKSFNDIDIEYLTKKMDLSKEISFKMVDLESKNRKAAVKMAMSLETSLMKIHLGHQKLILRTMVELQNVRNEIYALWTELYGIHNKDLSLYYSVFLDKLQLMVDINKENVERYKGIIEGKRAVLKSVMDKLTTLLKQYELEVDAYRTSVDGYDVYNSARAAYLKAQNEIAVSNASVNMTSNVLEESIKVSEADMNSSISEAIAKCSSSIAGASSGIYVYDKNTQFSLRSEISDASYVKEDHTYKEK